MKIIDLTSSYVENILQEDDLKKYMESYPELFNHYFKYWANIDYWHKELEKNEVNERLNKIKEKLTYIENKFEEKGFNLENIEVILFVGQGTTNGHAFQKDSSFSVFIPIEAYKSEKQMEIFITHEIIHALHYQKCPELYFNNIEEKENTERQLITEGVATFLTKEFLKISDEEVLWADYLTEEELNVWLNECKKEKDLVLNEIENNDDKIKEIFLANDPGDIRKYRVGYYIGLEMVKELVSEKGLSIKEVLNINKIDSNFLN
jgi:uncharacterized protein YjaZ